MKKAFEFFIEKAIFVSGAASIIFVILIFIFLLREGMLLFSEVPIQKFLFGINWLPISDPPQFGILPLILGSLWVTFGAILIAVPLGVAAAIYVAEVAPGWMRGILKSGIELLAAIPSIVLGFIGVVFLSPLLKNLFHLPSGLTALAGSIMLAFMAMPTIVSIIEDSIVSVPKSYKEGSLALGATHWQTIYRVTLPAAASGILAAVMLGIGRVIGETMAVLMVTGNAAILPTSILQPVRTLTATIAAEMGEAVAGSSHYYALFAIGIVLFIISFVINLAADILLHKK
jgi:phosphate transport system permease protein